MNPLPEMREIADFPGYFAGADGFIYSERRGGKTKKLKGNPCGVRGILYFRVALYRDGPNYRFVHHLILNSWVSPRPAKKFEGAHKDGNSLNNIPENLKWATKLENEADKRIHGTLPTGLRSGAYTKPEKVNRGERHYRAKLSDADAEFIRQFLTRPDLVRGDGLRMAEKFNVDPTLVSMIKRGLAHCPGGAAKAKARYARP